MSSIQNNHLTIVQIGYGVVGKHCAKALIRDRALVKERSGVDLELKTIAKRDLSPDALDGLPRNLFVSDYKEAVDVPEVDVVVELVGGIDVAKEIVVFALEKGKHVVTANKALLAVHGIELFEIAQANGVCINFEASCGGGIPIIRALNDGLLANSLDALYGIVNGTSNYILTEMIERGTSYEEALSDAQKLGLAEPDPSFDVEGIDSAHKISILSTLAFGVRVPFESISVSGITELDKADVSAGAEMGYVIKLIAMAVKSHSGIAVRVEPAFIGEDHPLAWVSGSFNAVSVYGHQVGHTLYYGRGAGGAPTSSAIIADLVSIGHGIAPLQFQQLPVFKKSIPSGALIASDDLERRYYVRLNVEDREGILAGITAILSTYHISVSSLIQKEDGDKDGKVPLVITTHRVKAHQIQKALEKIVTGTGIDQRYVLLPIIAEHDEFTPPIAHRTRG